MGGILDAPGEAGAPSLRGQGRLGPLAGPSPTPLLTFAASDMNARFRDGSELVEGGTGANAGKGLLVREKGLAESQPATCPRLTAALLGGLSPALVTCPGLRFRCSRC